MSHCPREARGNVTLLSAAGYALTRTGQRNCTVRTVQLTDDQPDP